MTELLFSDIWYWFVVMAIVSYFVGCFNFALLISKIKHKDVRKMGSGNPGTMNMSRQFGLKIGGLTLLCDMIKGGLPLLIAYFIFRNCVFAGTDVLVSDLARYVCGVSVIVGHIYPVTMKFKGGKGIATSFGCLLIVFPVQTLCAFGVFLLIVALTRYVSAGSLGAAVTLPFFIMLTTPCNPVIWGSVIAICLLAIWRHAPNIKRLMNHTESKISLSKKK